MKTTRRRLFGLVCALAALAAVPPSLAAAAPAPTPDLPRADLVVVSNSATGMAWRKLPPPFAGGTVAANHPNHWVGERGCELIVPTQVTTNIAKGGELRVTITTDTSQVEAALAALEARAVRLRGPVWDVSIWDTEGPVWDD